MKKKQILKILGWIFLFPFMLTFWGWKKHNKPVIFIGVLLSILFLISGLYKGDDPSINDRDSLNTNEVVGENELKVSPPLTSTDFKGKQYEEVIDDFESEGFINIKTKVLEDLDIGKLMKEGQVDSVVIAGKEDYSTSEEYSPNVEVVISYHPLQMDEEAQNSDDETQVNDEVSENTKIERNSGYDKNTNETIIWGGVEFSFPSYFDVLEDGANDSYRMYYPKEKDYYASLAFQKEDFTKTKEDFNDKVDVFVQNINDIKNLDIQESEAVRIASFSGWTISYIEDNNEGNISKGIISIIYNDIDEEVIMITCVYDNDDKSQYDYLEDYSKIIENAKLVSSDIVAETIDLKTINGTNSAEDNSQFIGKHYILSGKVYQAMGGDDPLILIWPETMAKGMNFTLPLELNIWMSDRGFNEIGGELSQGKNVEIVAELISIRRNTENPSIKGYPIELEFREINR